MALPFNTTDASDSPCIPEAWIWPLIAAIVMCGVITVGSLAGIVWLASHPARSPIVIWMPAAAVATDTSAALPDDSALADQH